LNCLFFDLPASGYPFDILVIVLSVFRLTASVYPLGILAIVLSVLPLTASGYLFGILAIVLSVFRLTAFGYPFGDQNTKGVTISVRRRTDNTMTKISKG
jgi:hypothetical protein